VGPALLGALARDATVVLQLVPDDRASFFEALGVADGAQVVAVIVGRSGTDIPAALSLQVRRLDVRHGPDGRIVLTPNDAG
jgi:hypothetical protein